MHGFPYDIHSYVEVAPLLAAEGYRVIVPYFRGYGTTTFLSDATPRNVDQAAFALDILALMDALGIERGHPGRVRLGVADRRHHRRAVAEAGQGPGLGERLPDHQPGRQQAAAAAAGGERLVVPVLLRTERGVLGLTEYRYELGVFVWQFNSPTWKFSTDTYDQTAAAFDNPDYVSIVIGNYRWRLEPVPGRTRVCQHREQASASPQHRSCHDHHRRRERPVHPARERVGVPGQVHRQVPAPGIPGWSQRAAGSPAGLRRGGCGRRSFLIGLDACPARGQGTRGSPINTKEQEMAADGG